MRKVFLITIFSFVTLFAFKAKAEAAIAEKVHNRTFQVSEDYLEVTESKETNITQYGFFIPSGAQEGFTIFNPVEGDPEAESKLQKTIESIRVTDKFGNELSYEIEETDSKNYIIKTKFPNEVNPFQNEKITLTYRSYGLLIKAGAIKDIYIPGFPEDYKFNDENYTETINTQIKIPIDEAQTNFVLPKLEEIREGEFRIINIPPELLIGKSTWLQLGTRQYFDFIIKQKVPATSFLPFYLNEFTITLPRDIQSGSVTQKVFYTKFSIEPFKVYEDRDGNLFATFKTLTTREEEIVIEGYAELSQNPEFQIASGGSLDTISSQVLQENTSPAIYWEVGNPSIIQTANEIKGSSTDVYEILNKTYQYVVNKIDYSFVKKYGINERQGALKTLQGGAAVCMEYSDLFISLMRAQGIPARAAFGYGYGSLDYESRLDNTINHQWAEVYLPEQNIWIPVDTTWGEFGPSIIGGDLNHFYSHVASVDPETPSTSKFSFFGSNKGIPERNMEINVVENLNRFNGATAYTPSELLEKYKEPDSELRETINLQLSSVSESTQRLILLTFSGIVILLSILFIKKLKKK